MGSSGEPGSLRQYGDRRGGGAVHPEWEGTDVRILYFNRRSTTTAADYDLYSVPLTRNGTPSGPAEPIAELNTPANDQTAERRTDGLEVLLSSNPSRYARRPGPLARYSPERP